MLTCPWCFTLPATIRLVTPCNALPQVFSNKAKQGLISSAQVAGKCCGFLTPADRAIQPCPAGAKAGCQSFLQSSLKKQLGFVGILFAGGAGACLFLMGAAHGWIERINFDRQKAASGSTNTMSAYSGLDGSRDASVPSSESAVLRCMHVARAF
jgi:hypothetical protein